MTFKYHTEEQAIHESVTYANPTEVTRQQFIMFAHMHEHFQDVADFIVPSAVKRQSLGNSRICVSGYEFVFTSSHETRNCGRVTLHAFLNVVEKLCYGIN